MIFKDMKFEGKVTEKRTIVGYAAAYGNTDHQNDILMPGSFAKSIKEAFPKGRIKMLWNHSEPLGMPVQMHEDSKGLHIEGRVSKTTLGNDVLELINDGVADRMSVGFSLMKGKYEIDNSTGLRKIHEGALREFSVVMFPANEKAAITGMKSLQEMREYLQGEEISDLIKAEMIAEIKSLATLLSIEPVKTTQIVTQPSVTKADILAVINDTLGSVARTIN
jgi:HK97 family phage prohead protease